jgi:hypothetical protein
MACLTSLIFRGMIISCEGESYHIGRVEKVWGGFMSIQFWDAFDHSCA